jgi:antitoxin (DNA-binding transcriptional repressor) of toxin-antitoxin stability system
VITISIEQLQRDVEAYFSRVEAGETLVITRGGQPVAEIKPPFEAMREPRPFGLAAGEFTAPDDFDEPLPEDLLRDFESR